MGLYVEKQSVNATEGYRWGSDGVQESRFETVGEVYRFGRKTFGRCVGKVYVDGPAGEPKVVGWIFARRKQYDDSPRTFLCETWVTVHDAPPTRSVEYHYHAIGKAA